MIIKQAVAYTRLFMMIQSSDHVSGLTGASPTVTLTKCNYQTGTTVTGTAANSPATEVSAGSSPGLYKITLGVGDTNVVGDLCLHCTAASGDPTDFIDQVQPQWFPDIVLATSGRALIGDNIQQNTAVNGFTFLMVTSANGTPATGLTVTAQRSLGGAGFSPCANPVTEISNGLYTINLATTDTNANTVALRFTATGAADNNILLITQP